MRFTKRKGTAKTEPKTKYLCGVNIMNNSIVRLATVAVFTLAAFSSQASVDTYRAHGSVVAVNSAENQITVKQDAVTELGWPARTFTYTAGNDTLKDVKVGQTVDVKFSSNNAFDGDAHFVTPVSQ